MNFSQFLLTSSRSEELCTFLPILDELHLIIQQKGCFHLIQQILNHYFLVHAVCELHAL